MVMQKHHMSHVTKKCDKRQTAHHHARQTRKFRAGALLCATLYKSMFDLTCIALYVLQPPINIFVTLPFAICLY